MPAPLLHNSLNSSPFEAEAYVKPQAGNAAAYYYAQRKKGWAQQTAIVAVRLAASAFKNSPGFRNTVFTFILALMAIVALPWQADESASIKLAALFNNKGTTVTATAAAQQAVTQALLNPEILQPQTPVATPTTATTAAVTVPAPIIPLANQGIEEKTIALRSGQSLQGLLQAASIVGDEANAIIKELKGVFDMRRLKAGQEVTLRVKRDGDITQLLGLSFNASSSKEIKVARTKTGFDAKAINVPTTLKRLVASGVVNSSLYDAASDAKLPRDVLGDVMKIFAHKIDFQRDVKKGDKFSVLYEQATTAKGDKVGDGQVIYAAIETAGKINRLYRYEYAKNQFDYFDDQGRTAKRGLMRTPVQAARMTSGFGMRRHPILGYSKMHEGVDFAAPVGTPIFAAGDGTIVKQGFFGAYGRYVQIRHNNRLQTAYAHLSRFADKLGKGDRVRQGQIIGYVGSSGRSTGPHLHYEVHIDGRKVNPLSVDVPTGRSLNKTEMAAFKAWRERLHAEFQAINKGLPAGAKLSGIAALQNKNPETSLFR